MPLSYKFTRANDGTVMELAEIDRLICIEMGVEVSDEDFSQEFDLISAIGDRVYANGTWNESAFVGIKTMPDALRATARKFLNGEYVYECWYSRGGRR